jgi:hypothetical protein
MAVNLSPVGGVAAQFFNNNGVILTGGKIFTYTAGTTTPQTTYTSFSGNTAHSNPIILDASGRVPSGEIWLTDGLQYKFVIKDSTDVLIGTYDNIIGINSNFINYTGAQEIQTATAGQTVFTLTTMQYQPGTNSLSVFVDGVNQYGPGAQYAYVETSGTVVTFVNGLHVGASVKFTTATINSSSYGNASQVGFTGFKGQTGNVQDLADDDGSDWVGFLQEGTGAVAISVQDKLRQVVNVNDFGAVGDGTTDDLAAIQAAINAVGTSGGGIVQLQAGFYTISDQLTINYDDVTIQGAGNNISWIKVTGANKNGIKVNGVSGTPIRNVMLRDFSIILATAATANSVGLDLNFTVFAIVERMQIHDFLFGFRMEGATNSQITKVGSTYTGSTNGFIGFVIYGGASGATSANASSILRDCYSSGVSGLTGQIGFKVYGSYMSDIQFDTCETALTNYGYTLDYSIAPSFNVDIIIRNPIVDRYFTQGILVQDLDSNGVLQIIGGYSNPDTLGAAAQNMYFDTCLGAVHVIGHQFMALTNTINTDGLYADNCTGFTISACVFTMLDKGIYMNSCGYSVIANNIFRGGNPSAFSKMIEVVGGARVMVNGNSFDGATEGVVIDATSSGCGIVGNTANVSTVATRYINSGSGPIGGADGSTGLNSGI